MIFVGCATSADNLSPIRWASWTAAGATGNGMHNINNCEPDCAAGTFTSFPVSVALSDPVSVDGMLVFATISMTPTTDVGQPETVTAAGLGGTWGWVGP